MITRFLWPAAWDGSHSHTMISCTLTPQFASWPQVSEQYPCGDLSFVTIITRLVTRLPFWRLCWPIFGLTQDILSFLKLYYIIFMHRLDFVCGGPLNHCNGATCCHPGESKSLPISYQVLWPITILKISLWLDDELKTCVYHVWCNVFFFSGVRDRGGHPTFLGCGRLDLLMKWGKTQCRRWWLL